jgi:hypothetical protein
MAFWDKLFEYMPTGNLVGDTLSAINGSPVAEARAPTGSFDPNRIQAAVPEAYREGMSPYIETLTGLENQKQQALMQAYEQPNSTWLQGFGRALSAASVPVAYAQGNLAYGNGMLGRTEQDIYNRRSERYNDQLAQAKAGGASALYNGLGTAAVDYITKRNDTKRAFAMQAAKIMNAARLTGNPQIIADAERQVSELARAQGLDGEAMPKSALSPTAPSAPSAPAAPGIPAGVGSDAQPSSVPGLSVTPPTGAARPQQPAAPASAVPGPSAVTSPVGQDPAALARYKRGQAAVAMAAGDKGTADALIEEAKLLEEPIQKGKIKFAEKRNEAAAENTTKAEMAQTLRKQMDQYIGEAERVLGKPGIDYYMGPIQGGVLGRYGTDMLSGWVPGNESGPADRAELQSIQNNLVQAMKPFLRVPGEGSQDQREFQSIIDSVGDLTAMPTAPDAQQLLNSLKRRISVMLSKYGTPEGVPDLNQRLSVKDRNGNDQTVTAPATSAKDAPLGEKRIINGRLYQKGKSGWNEIRDAAPDWQEAY